MKILERCHQRVKGKFQEFIALEKKFDAAEEKLGNVPPKRRYWSHYSGLPNDTYVWEREWENQAALDAYGAKIWNNPEWDKLTEEAGKVFFDGYFELYYSFTWEDFPHT